MSSTPSTAHRRDFCRALYLLPSDNKLACGANKGHEYCVFKHLSISWFSVIRQTSTAAYKLSRQWAVRQVQPIVGIFAERCIYYLLTTNVFQHVTLWGPLRKLNTFPFIVLWGALKPYANLQFLICREQLAHMWAALTQLSSSIFELSTFFLIFAHY